MKTEQELLNLKPNSEPICSKFREIFVKQCPGSWVEHFEKLRVEEITRDYFVSKMEKVELDTEFWDNVKKK